MKPKMKGMSMSNSLKNKVAVVTGGTSEIGEAAALALAEVGAKVVVAGRHEKERHAIVDAIEKFGGKDFILPGRRDETRFFVPINVFKAIEFPVIVRRKRAGRRLWLGLLCLGLAVRAQAQERPLFTNDVSVTQPVLEASPERIWENGMGEGFRPSAQSITVSAGATYGFKAFNGRQEHDLALTSITYGHVLGHTVGQDHWWRGNFEGRLELFTGAQFSPSSEWLVGLTPHLRYNFATATRWIPFVDAGAGVTGTSIGAPDLSGTFEFNLQGGGGIQWFVKDNMAISVEARYVHFSNAGIRDPDHGLNGVTGLIG